jgi:hypothetical protein
MSGMWGRSAAGIPDCAICRGDVGEAAVRARDQRAKRIIPDAAFGFEECSWRRMPLLLGKIISTRQTRPQ